MSRKLEVFYSDRSKAKAKKEEVEVNLYIDFAQVVRVNHMCMLILSG